MNSKISVYVPAYNAEKTIETCINSILNQTIRPDTILIINDCSTDETAKILNNDSKLTEEAGTFFSKILIDAYLICKCNKKNYNKENKSISRSQRFYYDENT